MATVSRVRFPHPTDTVLQQINPSRRRSVITSDSPRGCHHGRRFFPAPRCSLLHDSSEKNVQYRLGFSSAPTTPRGSRISHSERLPVAGNALPRSETARPAHDAGESSSLRKDVSCHAKVRTSEIELAATAVTTTEKVQRGGVLAAMVEDMLSVLETKRAQVVSMLALGLVLCNADRVIMSVAIVPLASSNGWGEGVSGIVQSSFLWGYMLTPVLGGGLADRYGGKRVLAAGMTLWSAATCLTPWAATHSLPALLTMRVLMGIGEGVAMPCMNNIVCAWIPKGERARAISLAMAGFHLGSMAGLLAAPGLMSYLGLSAPFLVFGALGLVWLPTWLLTIPPDPRVHPSISPSELHYILGGPNTPPPPPLLPQSKVSLHKPVSETTLANGTNGPQGRQLPPFKLLLSKAPVWALIVANSVYNWGYFLLLSWMPVYFNRVLGVDLWHAAWFSALPWAVMAVTGFASAAAADTLTARGVRTTEVRKVMQTIGFLGPAVSLAALGNADDANVGLVCLTLAVAFSSFSQSGFLVNYQDIGPRYAGVLNGISNTCGIAVGIVGTASTGFLVESTGSFQTPLTLCCILYFGGTVFWNIFATGDNIFD